MGLSTLIFSLLFFFSPSLWGQGGNTITTTGTGAPTGGCAFLMFYSRNDANEVYGCRANAYFLIGPGAAGAASWSSLTAPTANLALSHGAFTSTFTWGAATGAGVNLFSFADTLNNTGTGFIFDFNRASGSVLAGPYRYRDNGVAKFQIAGSGRTRVATEVSVYETADVADNTNFSMFDIFSSGTTWRLQSHAAGTGALRPILFGTDDNTTFTERLRLSTSGGLSLGTGAVDPGVGVFNVDTGYRLGNAAVSGNVLRGNGTNFVSAVLALADTTGTLAVGRGGTGATTFTLDGVLLGNTTSPVAVTAAGTANQVFRVPGAGGSPAFGAVDLAQAAAVTGLLPDSNIAATISRDTEAPGAGDITGSLSGGYQIGAAAVASPELAIANKQLTSSITVLDPATALTNKAQIYWAAAVTLQEVTCSSLPAASTVTIQLDERAEATPNTAGTNSLTANLICDDTSETTTAFADSVIAAEVPHNLQIVAVAGTPTAVRIHIRAQIN